MHKVDYDRMSSFSFSALFVNNPRESSVSRFILLLSLRFILSSSHCLAMDKAFDAIYSFLGFA